MSNKILIDFFLNQEISSHNLKKLHSMTFEVKLNIMKNLHLHYVSFHTNFCKISMRKWIFINEKMIFSDLQWPLRIYFITWKICVFIMLTFTRIFIKTSTVLDKDKPLFLLFSKSLAKRYRHKNISICIKLFIDLFRNFLYGSFDWN